MAVSNPSCRPGRGGGASPPSASWNTGGAEARRPGQGRGPLCTVYWDRWTAGAGMRTGTGAQQKPAGSYLGVSPVSCPGILRGCTLRECCSWLRPPTGVATQPITGFTRPMTSATPGAPGAHSCGGLGWCWTL